jgi:protein-glutamine gamma-glutamyltransferase
VVRDLDAHSWVEVYFNRIGWVPFDPTPGAAPAKSQASGLRPPNPNRPSGAKALPKQWKRATKLRRPEGLRPATAPSRGSFPPWLVPLFAMLPALAGGIALGVRRHRFRTLPPAAAAEARLRELEAALPRLRSWTTGGMTLLALEERLATVAGPVAASYAAKLRAVRYEPRDPGAPTAEERRALRRGLTAGLGLGGRVRGLLAIPPGGPASSRRLRRSR